VSVLLILELSIEPESVEAYLAQFPQILPDTRAFDGCEEIRVQQNVDDPTDVVLLERWASREQFETYATWRRDRGDLEQLDKGLAGRPKMRFYRDVDV
jgi:quinol monooxygenase YgiN